MKSHVLKTIAALEKKQTVFETLSRTAKRYEAQESYSRKAQRIPGLIIALKEVFAEKPTFGTVQALPNIDLKKKD